MLAMTEIGIKKCDPKVAFFVAVGVVGILRDIGFVGINKIPYLPYFPFLLQLPYLLHLPKHKRGLTLRFGGEFSEFNEFNEFSVLENE